MNVIGYTRYPGAAKLLYAGGDAAAAAKTANSGTSKPTASSTGEIVQISDAAKAASDKLSSDQATTAPSLKSRVDKLFQEARDAGTFITFDSSKGGVWMDLSSFTDDELAQITNDKGREYPQDLSDYAQGALSARLAKTLAPFENDLAAYQTGVQQLYKAMTPDVRDALGWDASMLDMSQKLVSFDEKHSGKLEHKSFLAQLIESIQQEGTLKVDTSLFGFDGESY